MKKIFFLQLTDDVLYNGSIVELIKILSLIDLVSLFNGISTFIGYLMPKPFFEKNSSGAI